ncbi:zinc finger BED domain-containing protein 5-like [Belonocnema kinseyi]|uniref:zinc finger BED domain-containing protein 5-like n=1 Tax=Belonocnema kinseyi TaxID=2817044 RepID=UPI00143D59A9|nr:zinc finger BED domain-containing protein 5-like [Belonocnema kinseyi]
MNQKRNLKRHFETWHADVDHSHPLGSALRAGKLQQLKAKYSQRCGKVKNEDIVSTNPHDCTLASFDISFQIAKAMKPFTDGHFIKNVIIQAATGWFPDEDNRRDFVNIVQNTHLSPATVTRRVNVMADNVHEQLNIDPKKCVCFLIQLDESTDKSDTAQLVVMICFVLENGSVQEELLELIPLKGKTTGFDVYLSLKNSILAHEVPLKKLVAVRTDGAPSMTGKITGLSGQCLHDPDFPRFLFFHCIIHQEVLCGKTLNMKTVFEVVKKVINSIRARALQHRVFKLLLENASAEFADLLLLNEVRWLSSGEVMFRFFKLLPEISCRCFKRNEHLE